MKLKELPTGTIFYVPSMPQWGIMMTSLLREDNHKPIIVCLRGNKWTWNHELIDDGLEVELLPEAEVILNHIQRSIFLNENKQLAKNSS